MCETSKKNNLTSKNFYLSIYTTILNTGKLPNNMPKQNRNYYVKQLVLEGVIRKLGYGVWEVVKPLEQQKEVKKEVKDHIIGTQKSFGKVGGVKNTIRAHGFQAVLQIPLIPNWSNRRKFLDLKNISWEEINKYGGEQFLFKKNKVQLTKKSIVLYTPVGLSYFGRSAEQGRQYAIYDFMQTIKGLENLLGVSLRINKEYRFKVSKQHYADIRNELAQQVTRNNQKIRVIGDDGKEWLIVDESYLPELETIHSEKANGDMDKVVSPFMNTLRRNPNILGDFDNQMQKLKEINLQTNLLNQENSKILNSVVQILHAQAEENKRTAEELRIAVQYLKARDGVQSLVPEVFSLDKPNYFS